MEFNAGYNRNGIGVRLNGTWQEGTSVIVDPSGAPSPRDLEFGSLFTANLRVFADLGQQQSLVRDMPFFRGSRVTLSVNNLFNQRLDVRDASGLTPVGYQPALLDPLGRSVRLRVSTNGLRSVEHVGGLDNWLAKTADDKLSIKAQRLKRKIAKAAGAKAAA